MICQAMDLHPPQAQVTPADERQYFPSMSFPLKRSPLASLMKGKRVILHIGAHKPATTFLQRQLAGNAEALKKHGVSYVDLRTMRSGITRARFSVPE